MLVKDISSFTIKGRCFEAQRKLDLFPGKNDRVSFVFGRNGSGKSTISSALNGKVNGVLPDGITFLVLPMPTAKSSKIKPKS